MEEAKKAAKPRPKLSEVLNRAAPAEHTAEEETASRLVTPMESAVSSVCYREVSEISRALSSVSDISSLPSPSPSPSPSRSASRSSKKPHSETRSPKRHSPSPHTSDNPSAISIKMPNYLSEAVSVVKPSLAQSQDSIKFPKITNSPLISAPDTTVPPDTSLRAELSTQLGVSQEDSALSVKSKCSRCGTKKPPRADPSPRGNPSHISNSTLESNPTLYTQTSSSYAQYPPHLRQTTLPSHNLHLSSPPVLIQHAPIPYTYIQPCHECVPAPQLHHCHRQQQVHCSPCPLHKEENIFSHEFEQLKEFIREEIRTGWTKSPRSRRHKGYSSSRDYTGTETTTPSETESEDPYLLPGQTRSSLSSKAARANKAYKSWKGPGMEMSVQSLAATHSLHSKRSEVSSILDDELFMKLVSNPAKYSNELQEIAKLLTSPPASRASSTTSRQKLRTIKHLVRDAISSYSTSEMDTSDTADEDVPHREAYDSEGNLSRLEHVSSRTIHKARKAKEQEMRGELQISPKPSILKTSSRTSQRAIDPVTSLTALKRVNFSSETINIDDGQPTQVSNIPDDYVVVEQDEISLATEQLQQNEQIASETVIETNASSVVPSDEIVPVLSSPTKSTMHVAYPYDQYIAGELADPYTILQNEGASVSHSESAASSRGGRVGAASRVLTEMGLDSELSNQLSYSHSLELKASLPSIPSYVSGTESRNSISLRPKNPGLESDTGANEVERVPSRAGLLSHSRASLQQVVPQDLRRDELEEEKRNNRSNQALPTPPDDPMDRVCAEEMFRRDDTQTQLASRRNSLTLREHESRRQSLTQLSRISLVSKPSLHMSVQQQQQQQPSLLEEEVATHSQTEGIIEKQTSKISLAEKASRILSSITSLVSLKGSGPKTSSQQVGAVAQQGSNAALHTNASNMYRAAKAQSEEANISTNKSAPEETQTVNSSVSASGSKQETQTANNMSASKIGYNEDMPEVNSSVSVSASKQDEIQVSKSGSIKGIRKTDSSANRTGSKEEIQRVNSSVSRINSKQDEIQTVSRSVSKSTSEREDTQDMKSSVSTSGSKQAVVQTVKSSVSKKGSYGEMPEVHSSVSNSGSKQEVSKNGSNKEIAKVTSSVSKIGSKGEIQTANSSVSRTAPIQEEIQTVSRSVSKSGSEQETENISVTKSASKQDEIQTVSRSVSKSSSEQGEIQKVNSSVSRTASKQEEIQTVSRSVSKSGSEQETENISVSKSASKQDEIQNVNSSLRKEGSDRDMPEVDSPVYRIGSKEEAHTVSSSVSKSISKQEEIRRVKSSVSNSASKRDIEYANSALSKKGSNDDIGKVDSSVSKSGSNDKIDAIADSNETTEKPPPPQCECTDCPDPTECTEACVCPELTQDKEQVPAESPSLQQVDATHSSVPIEAPVRIVLSPEVVVVDSTEERETEMGVVMTFSKEWKIVCTKDCPDGVQETTITDWRDPNIDSEIIQVTQSSEPTGEGTDTVESENAEADIDTRQESESPDPERDAFKITTDTSEPVPDTTELTERSESASMPQQQLVANSNSGVTKETGDSLEQENRETDAPEENNTISVSEEGKEDPEVTVEAPQDTLPDSTGPIGTNITETPPENAQSEESSPAPEVRDANTELELIPTNLSSDKDSPMERETANGESDGVTESSYALQTETEEHSPQSGEPQIAAEQSNDLPIDSTDTPSDNTPNTEMPSPDYQQA